MDNATKKVTYRIREMDTNVIAKIKNIFSSYRLGEPSTAFLEWLDNELRYYKWSTGAYQIQMSKKDLLAHIDKAMTFLIRSK